MKGLQAGVERLIGLLRNNFGDAVKDGSAIGEDGETRSGAQRD